MIEEFLDGEEVSFFALVDGEAAVPLVRLLGCRGQRQAHAAGNPACAAAVSRMRCCCPALPAVLCAVAVLA